MIYTYIYSVYMYTHILQQNINQPSNINQQKSKSQHKTEQTLKKQDTLYPKTPQCMLKDNVVGEIKDFKSFLVKNDLGPQDFWNVVKRMTCGEQCLGELRERLQGNSRGPLPQVHFVPWIVLVRDFVPLMTNIDITFIFI